MTNENITASGNANQPAAPTDPQQQYDDSLNEYTKGDAIESQDDGPHRFTGRFPRDFYKYSQDFHDREDGAPGIDQDFATNAGTISHDTIAPAPQMPEGDGVSESAPDRVIREEIMDLLSRDTDLDANDVTARVEDGNVTLSGTVVSLEMKTAIEESIQLVPGVDDVMNCLIVNSREDLN